MCIQGRIHLREDGGETPGERTPGKKGEGKEVKERR